MIRLLKCIDCGMPAPEGHACFCKRDAYPNYDKRDGSALDAIVMVLSAMATSLRALSDYSKFSEIVDSVISQVNERERPKDVVTLTGFFDSKRWAARKHRDNIKKSDFVQTYIDGCLNGEADLRRMMALDLIAGQVKEHMGDNAHVYMVAVKGYVEAEIAISNAFRRNQRKELLMKDPLVKAMMESGVPVEIIDLLS